MIITALQTEKIEPQQTLPPIHEWILDHLKRQQVQIKNGYILVLSSKIVSYFEGNLVQLEDQSLEDLVKSEADEVIAQTPWVALTKKNGIYSANAGIDLSNVPKGMAVLWPEDPFLSAANLRTQLMQKLSLSKLAILIIDSVCIPGRRGTISLAIGYAGMSGIEDLKGKSDLFSNTLKYSCRNIVDSLATAANLEMGESDQARPLAIIRDIVWEQCPDTKKDEMIISSSEDMFPLGK